MSETELQNFKKTIGMLSMRAAPSELINISYYRVLELITQIEKLNQELNEAEEREREERKQFLQMTGIFEARGERNLVEFVVGTYKKVLDRHNLGDEFEWCGVDIVDELCKSLKDARQAYRELRSETRRRSEDGTSAVVIRGDI